MVLIHTSTAFALTLQGMKLIPKNKHQRFLQHSNSQENLPSSGTKLLILNYDLNTF